MLSNSSKRLRAKQSVQARSAVSLMQGMLGMTCYRARHCLWHTSTGLLSSVVVAARCPLPMQADKLFCITTPSLQPYELPHWVPLHDSEALLKSLLEQTPAPGADVPAHGGSGAPSNVAPGNKAQPAARLGQGLTC